MVPLWVSEGTDKEQVLVDVVRVLGPYIGANMARASARGHMDKLGFGRRLMPEDIEQLLAKLRPALSVFVGRDRTEAVLSELQAALDGSPDGARRSR
jgi:hypothetical protein